MDDFLIQMDVYYKRLKALPRAADFDEILMPGEPENRKTEAARKNGISLSGNIQESLYLECQARGVDCEDIAINRKMQWKFFAWFKSDIVHRLRVYHGKLFRGQRPEASPSAGDIDFSIVRKAQISGRAAAHTTVEKVLCHPTGKRKLLL